MKIFYVCLLKFKTLSFVSFDQFFLLFCMITKNRESERIEELIVNSRIYIFIGGIERIARQRTIRSALGTK